MPDNTQFKNGFFYLMVDLIFVFCLNFFNVSNNWLCVKT